MPPTSRRFFTARSATSGLIVLPLLALVSCASPRPIGRTESVVDVPARWAGADLPRGHLDTRSLACWWENFSDPVLTNLVAEALRSNPDLRTAQARIEESRARRRVQRAAFFPSLTASASSRGSRATDRDSGITTSSASAGASLDAGWEIDLFGRNRQLSAATAADLAQTEESARAAQVSLVAEVATAYVSLRATEAKLSVTRQTIASLEEGLRFNQWSEQAGTASALDTQQALTNLEQTRASVPALELALTETRNQLAILCGRSPGALDATLVETAAVPAAPAGLSVGIPAETLRQRPDVRAAAHAVEAAAARTSAAQRDRLPTLSLTGSLGVEALHASGLFSPDASVASLVGGLSAPLFAGGRIDQTIRIQAAAEKQAIIAYESTVLQALAEVENALAALRRQTERLAALDRATAAARETDTLARQRYEAGTVDYLTVLDAQRTLLALQESRVSTAADVTAAHVQLYKALGGGWTNF